MPAFRGKITQEGAIVDVWIGLSAVSVRSLRLGLRPVPSPIATRGLLDTGAEITCVDAAIIQRLALPFGGLITANLPGHGGVSFGFVHDAAVTIRHPSGNPRDHLEIRNGTVLELSLASLGYEVLIGRDILARCRFLFDGQGSRFMLAY